MKQVLTRSLLLTLLVGLMALRSKDNTLEILSRGYVKAGSIYVSSTEVTNLQYRLFLQALSTKGDVKKTEAASPKQAAWSSFFNATAYREQYFNHSAYDAYPMVCISRQAAELYCEWLTETHNAQSNEKRLYRLPSEAEWMQAAQGGDATTTYPWKGNTLTYEKNGKWKGEFLANFRVATKGESTAKENLNADVTAPVKSYFPNAYGIYNMAGNVAEMVAEKGFVKGGHWHGQADLLRIAAKEGFAGDVTPSPTIGFRPVYEIISTK